MRSCFDLKWMNKTEWLKISFWQIFTMYDAFWSFTSLKCINHHSYTFNSPHKPHQNWNLTNQSWIHPIKLAWERKYSHNIYMRTQNCWILILSVNICWINSTLKVQQEERHPDSRTKWLSMYLHTSWEQREQTFNPTCNKSFVHILCTSVCSLHCCERITKHNQHTSCS